MQAKSETPADYRIRNEKRDSATIKRALRILESRMVKGKSFTSPDDVKNFLIMHNAQHDQYRERFGVIYLDSQHAMIEYRIEFIGTLSQTSIYPREIVRHALGVNAASVILTHNHPSGSLEPSRADEELTKTLKSVLSMVDVRVLDHFITSGGRAQSMAELGLV